MPTVAQILKKAKETEDGMYWVPRDASQPDCLKSLQSVDGNLSEEAIVSARFGFFTDEKDGKKINQLSIKVVWKYNEHLVEYGDFVTHNMVKLAEKHGNLNIKIYEMLDEHQKSVKPFFRFPKKEEQRKKGFGERAFKPVINEYTKYFKAKLDANGAPIKKNGKEVLKKGSLADFFTPEDYDKFMNPEKCESGKSTYGHICKMNLVWNFGRMKCPEQVWYGVHYLRQAILLEVQNREQTPDGYVLEESDNEEAEQNNNDAEPSDLSVGETRPRDESGNNDEESEEPPAKKSRFEENDETPNEEE